MEWFKRKVVMLQSIEKAQKGQLCITPLGLAVSQYNGKCNHDAQHLYFLSDDPIQDNDWFVKMNYGGKPALYQEHKKAFMNSEWLNSGDVKDCFKVIATTDKSLEINDDRLSPCFGIKYVKNLPEPSKDFLEIYANAYNQGKQIDEVLMAYEDVDNYVYNHAGTHKVNEPISMLYVKNDNTVSIRKAVEKMYSRAEVEKIVKECYSYPENFGTGICFDQNKLNEWIKENL